MSASGYVTADLALLAFALLALACLGGVCASLLGSLREDGMTRERLDEILSLTMRLNPHAPMLGREVEALFYKGSKYWERCIVVAVSWKGAVCVRKAAYPTAKGNWISKDEVRDRVREIADG